jgi:hypothetical protein
VLNAGATPPMGRFTNSAGKISAGRGTSTSRPAFTGCRKRCGCGSRVIIASSGAALNGSPLSGSYAGAKRMLSLMAVYANDLAKRLDLGIRFQAIVPQQIIGDTELGRTAAEAYASSKGVSLKTFLAGFGAPMPPRKVGDNVVSILTDPAYATGVAFGMKGDIGVVPLDA